MNADRRDAALPLLFRFGTPARSAASPFRYDDEQSLNVTCEPKPAVFATSPGSTAYTKTDQADVGED